METTLAMTSPTDTDAREGFQALLQAHRGIVAKVAGTYAWHPDDRDDLMQEIATQLWRAWPGYDPQRPAATWMYRIALNVAIGHLRQQELRRRHDAVPLDDALHDVPDGNAIDPEHAQRLRLLQGFIARQPSLDRALLLLYLDDRPQRDIAEILGISQKAVETRLYRARARLAEMLKKV